jgi:hypothetical protein
MYGLLGELLPMGMPPDQPLAERIRDGHDFLVKLAGVDLGYDPMKWHEHLVASNAGGYRFSNGHRGFPRQIAEALADEDWRAAVEELTRAQPRSGEST